MPETRYARSGDVNIAYQVFGEGETPLVWIPGFTQHLELNWEESNRRAWFEGLGRIARVVTLDKRGTGLSDRVEGSPPLEVRMDDIRAVLDAAGIDRAVIAVAGDSGPLGVLFAATHVDRTLGLILCNAFTNFTRTPDMPWLPSPEDYAAWVDETQRRWGDTDFWDEMFVHSPSLETRDERLEFARPIRLSVSPGNMAQYLRLNADIDLRDVLPTVRVPTLVLVRSEVGDNARLTAGYVADRIPTARLEVLPGRDLIPLVFDRESLFSEFEAFLDEVREGVPQEPDRVLATVLFTDIVGSTAKATELGDRAWRDLLSEHHSRIRRELSAIVARRSTRPATGSSPRSTAPRGRSGAPAPRPRPCAGSGSRFVQACTRVSASSWTARSAGSPFTSARAFRAKPGPARCWCRAP